MMTATTICPAEKPNGRGGVFQCTEPAGHDGPHRAEGPDGPDETYAVWADAEASQ